MQNSIPDRYEQNPMLILLENYVLDALGLLQPDQIHKLNDIVTRSFGGPDWKSSLRKQFNLPPDTDNSLRNLWKQRQEQADAQQQDLSPEQFAQEVADDMLSDTGN